MKRLYYTFLLLIVLSCGKQPDALDIPSITPGKDDSQEEYLPSVTGRLSDGRMFLMWTGHDDKGSRRPVIMRFKDEF